MTTLDNLSKKIESLVDDYVDEILPKLEKVLQETAKEIIVYIKTKAPRSGKKNALADSFITETKGSGVNQTITIFSKTEGRIVHLVEFGFAHKSGQFVGPRPFLRPAYDLLSPSMIEEIKRIIEKGI